MARPKVCVRGPLPKDPAEGHRGVSATALRPSTGSVQENEKPVSVVGDTTGSVSAVVHVHDLIRRPPRLQLPAAHVKTEHDINPALEEKPSLEKLLQDFFRRPPRVLLPAAHFNTAHDFNPALEEKPSLEAPVSGPVYIFPGAEGQQATAPAVGPSTLAPVREELGHGAGGQTPLLVDVIQQQRARLQKENQGVIPAAPVSASISTAALVGKKPRAAWGINISHADMVSDAHLLLAEKAHKLGVSVSCFKDRRRRARLGRWPGRKVRADMKREEARARRA